MKSKILLLLLLGLFSISTIQAQKERDKFTVQVDGLGCPFCAYGLEKKFKELKGIKNVKIEIDTGMFSFTYPAAKKLSIDRVKKQVMAAGYTPVITTIKRSNGETENDKS